MSSAPPEGSLTRANPPPPIELSRGSVTATAAAAASAAYGVPAAAAKVGLAPVVFTTGYYAPSLLPRAANGKKRGTHALPTWAVVPSRTPSLAIYVNDSLLLATLALCGRLGSQPQGEVGRLHGL